MDSNYKTISIGPEQDHTITLTDEQYKVVTAPLDITQRIISVAGSGKTTTIVCRIKYLLEHNIDPSTIILATFNVDAAQSMTARLKSVMNNQIPKIKIGTMDSIACSFYYKYFKRDGYVGVNEYSTYLLQYLEGPHKDTILNQYHYFFFDEFQDVDEIQFKILQKFYEAGTKLIVIGDNHQNIYSFRNSKVEYIVNFDKYFPDQVTYELSYNYRSTPEIIALANSSIKNNTDHLFTEMKATKKSIKQLPTVQHYKDEVNQSLNIINKIYGYICQGTSPGSIAVIARNNKPLKILEEQLEKYPIKIPYIALITDSSADSKPKINPESITLTTIHKAKGLEWSHVFLISCDDYCFPSDLDNISIQEERRLFYVAVTRAKTHLHISFTGYTVTRFVIELNPSTYNFINFQQRFVKVSNNRETNIKNSVTEMIELLGPKEIQYLRQHNIIPSIEKEEETIHTGTLINPEIDTHYLNADYGTFIDRYITRQIGKNNKDSKGLTDNSVSSLLTCLEISPDLHKIYNKYKANFQLKLPEITTNNSKNKKIDPLTLLKTGPVEIPNKDIPNLRTILDLIKDRANSMKPPKKFEDILVLPENYIPAHFYEELSNSYKNFQNSKKKSSNILYDIYKVSLCENINSGRRRLLYKNVDNIFTEKQEIFTNIDIYINSIKSNNLVCKKILFDAELNILGEIDLLDLTNNKLIDFKCSKAQECKLEWVLQLLAYSSLLLKLENIQVNQIEIYNPLNGVITTFDISTWTKQIDLLEYMNKVRNKQASRNKGFTIDT